MTAVQRVVPELFPPRWRVTPPQVRGTDQRRSYWYRLNWCIRAWTFATYVGLVAYPAFQIWYRNWSALPVYGNAGAYRSLTTRKRPWSRNESRALAYVRNAAVVAT